ETIATFSTRRIFQAMFALEDSGGRLSFEEVHARLEEADQNLLAQAVLNEDAEVTREEVLAAVHSLNRSEEQHRRTQLKARIKEQEEIYFIVEGHGEMCLGEERISVEGGQAIYIPPTVFHQLTNTGSLPMRMIYCYGPAGDVAHWRQELEGALPRAGIDVPP